MNNKKILILIIYLFAAAAFVFSLSSCEDAGQDENPSAQGTEYFDSLPSDLDFGGKTVSIIHWNNEFVNRELTADAVKNDAFDKAVLERNESVCSRLGVQLKFIAGEIAPEYYMPIVEEDILSGTGDFDIISGVQCQSGKLCAAGCYLDLSAAKYIDLNKSYWNNDYINQLKIGSSRIYMLGGDISLTTTAWASTMLYDKPLYNDLFGSSDKFYDEILNGEWTLDLFFDKCRGAYSDINGNGERDVNDRYGLGLMTSGSIIDMFFFSSGAKFSTRDSSNYPILDVNNSKSAEFLSCFIDAIEHNDGIWAYNYDDQQDNYINALFEATTMDAISLNTHDFNDFGVIPYPKLNEKEKNYKSWISDNTSVFSVPVDIAENKTDMVFAVIEAMASETRRICLPAYYETALKDKYTRDAQSRTMLDLIHDGTTSDFVSIYSESLEGVGTLMRKLIAFGESDIDKNFADTIKSANLKLTEIISEYEKNNSGKKTDGTDTTEPEDIVLDDYIPVNDISEAFTVFGGKYRASGVLLSNDISDSFRYFYNDDGGISVMSPPNSVKGGYFPTSAIQSRETFGLSDLSVSFSANHGFEYTNAGYSASFSFVWTDKRIEKLPGYTDQIGTNGLREAVPEDAHALSVIFMGTNNTSGTVSDLMYIVLNDGTGTAPEIDHRIGYRWSFPVLTDLSKGVEISIREDETLGYVVSVNGVEYREGSHGGTTIPVDLTPLKDAKAGYLCMGAEATGSGEYANFTWHHLNGTRLSDLFLDMAETDDISDQTD